jgi:hypothetical protein
MPTTKIPLSLRSLVFIGLLVISLVGIASLAVIIDELTKSGGSVPGFIQPYFIYRDAWQGGTGNEFTGVVTAWLFGISIVPVGIDWISRAIIQYMPFGDIVAAFVQRANIVQRKYLMPFHTYLSILAMGLGILHLTLSSCVDNPLPDFGLILFVILVVTGLLFKWNVVPKTIRKALYQFDCLRVFIGLVVYRSCCHGFELK